MASAFLASPAAFFQRTLTKTVSAIDPAKIVVLVVQESVALFHDLHVVRWYIDKRNCYIEME
jgi:hypothetical protein